MAKTIIEYLENNKKLLQNHYQKVKHLDSNFFDKERCYTYLRVLLLWFSKTQVFLLCTGTILHVGKKAYFYYYCYIIYLFVHFCMRLYA